MKKVTVYGPGCPKCKQTEELVRRVLKEIKAEAQVEKIEDLKNIIAAGILSTPAVAVDGAVKVSGRLPKPEEIKKWLAE